MGCWAWGTRKMRPTLGLNKDRSRAVFRKKDKFTWVGAHLGQALSKAVVWHEFVHALLRAIQEVGAVTVLDT